MKKITFIHLLTAYFIIKMSFHHIDSIFLHNVVFSFNNFDSHYTETPSPKLILTLTFSGIQQVYLSGNITVNFKVPEKK